MVNSTPVPEKQSTSTRRLTRLQQIIDLIGISSLIHKPVRLLCLCQSLLTDGVFAPAIMLAPTLTLLSNRALKACIRWSQHGDVRGYNASEQQR